jgi:ERCC4-type nuclease
MSDDEPLPTLPALRGLGKLADMRPCLIQDSREETPFHFTRLPWVIDGLQTGDYSMRGCEHLFCVERKSLADFVGCCKGDNRARFERELIRARGYRFARILIVATQMEIDMGEWRSEITPNAVKATMASFEARYIPIVLTPTPETGALLVERWAWRFAYEIVTAANDLLRGSTPPPAPEKTA